jgi:glucokinase
MANFILAGDIGGTNTRLALFDDDQQPRDIREYSSTRFPGLEPIIEQYLKDTNAPKAAFGRAGFGVAGPVEQGPDGLCVHGTNLSWGVTQATLARALGLATDHVGLLNDLAANALGATVVAPARTVMIQAGEECPGHRAIISAGTGLGVAGLYWDGKKHSPFPSEGGHSNFGPRNEREDALLEYLRAKDTDRFNGHVSWERVLSGPGLYNLFDFLRYAGIAEQKLQLADGIKPGEAAKLISKAGMEGSCPRSVEALDWFVTIYGAAAGNVAIQFLALGGIYIGGGIAPKLIEKLKKPEFINAFLEKGRLKEQVLQRIPVRVVLDEYAALRGAALNASRL